MSCCCDATGSRQESLERRENERERELIGRETYGLVSHLELCFKMKGAKVSTRFESRWTELTFETSHCYGAAMTQSVWRLGYCVNVDVRVIAVPFSVEARRVFLS